MPLWFVVVSQDFINQIWFNCELEATTGQLRNHSSCGLKGGSLQNSTIVFVCESFKKAIIVGSSFYSNFLTGLFIAWNVHFDNLELYCGTAVMRLLARLQGYPR